MAETLVIGIAAVAFVAMVWRAKHHGDRAEAAVKTMKRVKREVFAKLGIEDDEDRPAIPGAGSEPEAVRAARFRGGR